MVQPLDAICDGSTAESADARPEVIGERLLKQLSDTGNSCQPVWKLQLLAEPDIADVVKALIDGHDWSVKLTSNPLCTRIGINMHNGLGPGKHSASEIIDATFSACRTEIADRIVDFVSSVVQHVAEGAGWCEDV